MQRLMKIRFAVLVVATPLMFAGQPNPTSDRATIVAFAEKAGVRALNFRQGDAEGFTRSRNDFSDAGWKDLMRTMQGFLDEKGAPTFTSSFVASGGARVVNNESGVVRLKIPGTLTQSNHVGKSTYRVVLQVVAGGDPVRIQKLEPIICVGAAKACE